MEMEDYSEQWEDHWSQQPGILEQGGLCGKFPLSRGEHYSFYLKGSEPKALRFHKRYCDECRRETLFLEKLIKPSDPDCTEEEDICQSCKTIYQCKD